MTGRHVIAAGALVCILLALPAFIRPPAESNIGGATRDRSSIVDLDTERIAAAAASRSRPTTTTEPPTTTTTAEPSTTSTIPHSRSTTTTVREDPPSPAAPTTAGDAGELIGRFTVTCYGPGDGFPAGQHTANGDPVGPGSVAVDPRVIPLGTAIRLEGLDDQAVADDTGGAIRGYHVDEWRADCSRNWGNPTVNIYRR